jgi:hypothetical protein
MARGSGRVIGGGAPGKVRKKSSIEGAGGWWCFSGASVLGPWRAAKRELRLVAEGRAWAPPSGPTRGPSDRGSSWELGARPVASPRVPATAGPVAGMAGLGPRSPVWRAFAQRAVLWPGRGRWVALPSRAELEAVARAAFLSLGRPAPAGLARQLAACGVPDSGITVDDLRDALLALGIPVALQDGPGGGLPGSGACWLGAGQMC